MTDAIIIPANKYSGSKTEQNLLDAFAAESKARNKYTYYASVAKKAGFEQLSSIFISTADNEKEHAKLWFKELNMLGNTITNLQDAASSEHHEWTKMYIQMAEDAENECFYDLAEKFRQIAAIEKAHEERFQALLSSLSRCEFFNKSEVQVWECRNCGHLVLSASAPDVCPVCNHPQAYFQIKPTNY